MIKLRVLMIEDDEDDAILVLRELRKGGYKVISRRVDTEEGMKDALLDEEKWDLIISDHDMPDFSAIRALVVFKNSGLDIPFIIVSGAIQENVAVMAMKAGAHDYLNKRNLSRLVPAVQRELQEARIRLERREGLEKLRKREQEFRTLAENAPDIVLRLDRDFRCVYMNIALKKETGIHREEVINKTIKEFPITKDVTQLWERTIAHIFKNEKEDDFYFNLDTAEGTKYFHARLVPEFDDESNIETVMAIARNITEIKKMEAILYHESIKTRRMHLTSLPDEFPQVPGIVFNAYYQPAKNIQGDYYNYIQYNGLILFYLIDAGSSNSKGVMQSALIKKEIKEYISMSSNSSNCNNLLSPGNILAYVMDKLYRDNTEDMKDTNMETVSPGIFLAMVNINENTMLYAYSGFNGSAFYYTPGEETIRIAADNCDNKAEHLTLTKYPEKQMVLTPGATLFLSSDGLKYINNHPETAERGIFQSFLPGAETPPELITKTIIEECLPLSGESAEDIAFLIIQATVNEERLFLEVESSVDSIGINTEKVRKFIENRGAAEFDLFAFSELLVNAVEHGNKYDGAKKAFVNVAITNKYLKFVVTDQGEGFNWRERIKREIELEDFSERGRGIILSRMTAEYLYYNERGNRVTLIQKLV